MAESAFADVLGNPGLGALVFISSGLTFQTPPPTSHMHEQAQPCRVQGVPGRAPQRVWGQLEEPGATCLVRSLSAMIFWSQGWLCGLTKVTVKLMGS